MRAALNSNWRENIVNLDASQSDLYLVRFYFFMESASKSALPPTNQPAIPPNAAVDLCEVVQY